jgi:predicted RNase H-like HicB family nuclease
LERESIKVYIVIIEQSPDGTFSAYLPDAPGCVACGDTLDEVRTLIRELNEPVPPPPTSIVDRVHAA